MEATVYNQQGKATGKYTLPPAVFGVRFNADLLHQVITASRANQRANTAQVKDRGAVRGGGKKPWRQKGTGRARHGSIRSPLWRGGGVTHGPTTARNYEQKINKKMKQQALAVALSRKAKDGEVLLVEALDLPTIKTKAAAGVIQALAKGAGLADLAYHSGSRALIALPAKNDAVVKSFRNLAAVNVAEARNISPLDLLTYKYFIIANPAVSVDLLAKRLA